MEQNLQPEAPPAPPVVATADELISSSPTVEKPEDALTHQNANGECTAWTNEKHNLYLDRLEASFVDQLHRFKRLRTFCSEQSSWDPNTSLKPSSKTCKTSGQFKVLRDGRWLKINFKRNLPSVDTAPDSYDVLNSPWIRHFKHRGDPVEVSDQNFVDGGQAEKPSNESMETRFMTAGADVSTKTWIMPSGKY